jgi:tRNA threonylcarbamoyladenosine biosynthesis protein TsaB
VIGVQAKHSAALLPAVEFALRQAGLSARELDAIVVGGGPGSFTGVRIAAATAKGLARALGVPLLVESSLAALALSAAAAQRSVCPLFDARRDQVYTACYRLANGALEQLAAPRACSIDEAMAEARRFGAACVGEGARIHEAALLAAGVPIVGGPHAVPRASALLRLAGAAAGPAVAAATWEPLYLRPSSAERSQS